MQRQMAQIQNVLAELQGQSQQENCEVRNSGEGSGGPRGGSSESSSEDEDNDEKERSLGTTGTKARKEALRQSTERMRHESQSARRIRDQFNGYKASDIHQWFKSGLAPVAVADRGDAKFAAALACWRRLCSDYEPSETVRIRLLGYAFSGVAATLFQEVMGETKRGITAGEVWTLMAAKLYNDDMIETQREKFNAASLEAGEDVSGLAKRLYELALGPPELQGSTRSILLMQRLKDALPSELRTHMATIRNTHSFDAAAAVLSQIKRERELKVGEDAVANRSGQ
jgi:hypothetical protein